MQGTKESHFFDPPKLGKPPKLEALMVFDMSLLKSHKHDHTFIFFPQMLIIAMHIYQLVNQEDRACPEGQFGHAGAMQDIPPTHMEIKRDV